MVDGEGCCILRLSLSIHFAGEVMVGDGQSPIPAECLRRDLDPGRGLTAFVLVAVYHKHYFLNSFSVEAVFNICYGQGLLSENT